MKLAHVASNGILEIVVPSNYATWTDQQLIAIGWKERIDVYPSDWDGNEDIICIYNFVEAETTITVNYGYRLDD